MRKNLLQYLVVFIVFLAVFGYVMPKSSRGILARCDKSCGAGSHCCEINNVEYCWKKGYKCPDDGKQCTGNAGCPKGQYCDKLGNSKFGICKIDRDPTATPKPRATNTPVPTANPGGPTHTPTPTQSRRTDRYS